MSARIIVRSIWITTVALFAGQVALVVTVVMVFGVDPGRVAWLLVTLPLLHAAMGVVLASLERLWINLHTGEALTRVNFANVLSMIRVSSSPTLLWLVLIADSYPVVLIVVPLTALVFLTDLLDGQISRRTRQTTKIGTYLDSSSDYTVLAIVAIALVSYDLLPMWLFLVVIARFGLQFLGQVALFLMRRRRLEFRTSFLGKMSVFTVMTLFALSLLRLAEGLPVWYETLYVIAEYLTAGVAIISLAEKFFLFTVDAQEARSRPDG